MNEMIQVSDLKKSYGKTEVLKGITFQAAENEILGILGVNGAGKTTTLECMEGFLNYESGSIQMHGSIGIQLQSASLPSYMKVNEALKLFANWKKASVPLNLIQDLGLQELKNKKYMELSFGQKRRLHLALAMIGNPDILFLDEPTAGLDVEGRRILHQQIRKLKQAGKTIILTSHDMSEVEELCDRIAILNHGKIAFLGSVEELSTHVGRCFHVQLTTQTGELNYQAENLQDLIQIFEDCLHKKLELVDLKINRGTLEEHFLKITKGESQ